MYRLLIVSACLLLVSGCSSLRPMPVYGCWCGQNQPPPGEHPTPVDIWDHACQLHDLCYREYGPNHPGCDAQFVGNLQFIALNTPYMPGQLQGAYSYFLSRLHGTTAIQASITPYDIATLVDSGSDYLCGS